MTGENIPGLQTVEAPSTETGVDISQQAGETEADIVASDPAVDTIQPAAIARPRRRRLGEEEPVRSGTSAEVLDAERAQRAIAGLRSEQNFTVGLVGGAVAALAGAILWAAVTVAVQVQIGWMAIGVAAMVGGTVRVLGKGITKPFGYLGAALSLGGCVVGNLLSICIIIAQQQDLSLSYVLTHLNPAAIPELVAVTFHPMDLLFYGLALYAGYRFAFRRVTMADVTRVAPD